MQTGFRHIFYALLVLEMSISLKSLGQNNPAPKRHWIYAVASDTIGLKASNQVLRYKIIKLDLKAIHSDLTADSSDSIIELPLPNGSTETFLLTMSTTMPTQMRKDFPSILSYRGKPVSGRVLNLALTVTNSEFHATIRASDDTYIISSLSPGSDYYIVYRRSDIKNVKDY